MAVYSEVAAGNMDAAYSYVAIIVVIAFISVVLMNWGALIRSTEVFNVLLGGKKNGYSNRTFSPAWS